MSVSLHCSQKVDEVTRLKSSEGTVGESLFHKSYISPDKETLPVEDTKIKDTNTSHSKPVEAGYFRPRCNIKHQRGYYLFQGNPERDFRKCENFKLSVRWSFVDHS